MQIDFTRLESLEIKRCNQSFLFIFVLRTLLFIQYEFAGKTGVFPQTHIVHNYIELILKNYFVTILNICVAQYSRYF